MFGGVQFWRGASQFADCDMARPGLPGLVRRPGRLRRCRRAGRAGPPIWPENDGGALAAAARLRGPPAAAAPQIDLEVLAERLKVVRAAVAPPLGCRNKVFRCRWLIVG